MKALSKRDSIYNLNLPIRILNRLRKSGFKTVNDLIQKDAQYLLKQKGFGIKSLYFLNKQLQKEISETIKGSEPYNITAEKQYSKVNINSSKTTTNTKKDVKEIEVDKNPVAEIIDEMLNSSAEYIIFSNPITESFVQFYIDDKKNFILDFPDYQTNANYNKEKDMQKLLLDLLFKIAPDGMSLQKREFAPEKLSNNARVVQANCGNDVHFVSELVETISIRILGLSDNSLLKVEYF